MAPFIVNKEEEREDSDDETGDNEHNNNQSRVHVLLLHYWFLVKYQQVNILTFSYFQHFFNNCFKIDFYVMTMNIVASMAYL